MCRKAAQIFYQLSYRETLMLAAISACKCKGQTDYSEAALTAVKYTYFFIVPYHCRKKHHINALSLSTKRKLIS